MQEHNELSVKATWKADFRREERARCPGRIEHDYANWRPEGAEGRR